MRPRNLIIGIALAAAVFAPQAVPVLGGTAPRRVDVEVLIAPSDAGKYELDIGKKAWRVENEGAASYLTKTPVTVQFWRVRDCALLATFRASPSTLFQIWVDPDSSDVTVQHPDIVDIPVGIIDTETTPRCSLPDSSTGVVVPKSGMPMESLVLGLLMLGTAVILFRTGGLKRRRR